MQDPMTGPMTGPMGYSTPRPIALYKIGLRYKDSSSSSKLEYSPYNFFAESREEGHLEIKEHCDGAPWMTTRSIIIRSSSLQELCGPSTFRIQMHEC